MLIEVLLGVVAAAVVRPAPIPAPLLLVTFKVAARALVLAVLPLVAPPPVVLLVVAALPLVAT